MKRTLIVLALFPVCALADNISAVFDETFIDTNKVGYLPIVIVENHERKDKVVYLSYHDKKQTFIFTNASNINEKIAAALSSLAPGIDLTFSCKEQAPSWCDEYESFDLHYDLYRSELVVFYIKKNKTTQLETDPLLIISNGMSYSTNQSRIDGNDSTFGFWSADVDYGVSNNLSLHAGSRYSFNEKSLGIDNLSVVRPFEWGDVTLFFNERSNFLSSFSADKFIGIGINNSNRERRAGQYGERSGILVTASSDGIFNLYDRFGELKQTSRAIRGLNNIVVSRGDFDRGIITIEVVQNGVVVESIERTIEGEYIGSQFQGLSIGVTTIRDEINQTNERIFAEADFVFDQIELSFGGIENHAYYFDAGYSLFDGFRFNGNVKYQQEDQLTESEIWVNYSGNALGWRYSPSLMYRFGGETDSASFNISLLKQLDDYLINLNYNQQKKWSNAIVMNDVQRRLDSSVASALYTKYAKISWSAYATTDLGNDHGLGLSLTFSPAVESAYIKPTLSASYSNDRYQIRGVNEVQINDALTLLPEVSLEQGHIAGYGMGSRITHDSFNSDIGAYRTEQSDSLNINLQSNVYISPYAVMARSEKRSSQLFFANKESDSDHAVELNIDGVRQHIQNEQAVLSDGATLNGNETRVYSLSDNVNIPEQFSQFIMPKYRAKKILFKTNHDRILVHGRVVNNGSPVSGATVINHIGQTVSDSNGYFQLQVSKAEPEISVYHNESQCNAFSLKKRESLNTEEFVGRLECSS